MNSSINIQHKLASLIRRNQPFYSLSYSWKQRKLIVHSDQDSYFEEIVSLRDQGMAKRSECYVGHFVQFGGVEYAIYMVSFGDIRKWKMVYGENPIAKNFNVCMLDFVFLFLQTKQFAAKKIQIRIKELTTLQKWHDYHNMRKTAETLFGGIFQKELNSNTELFKPTHSIKDQSEEN